MILHTYMQKFTHTADDSIVKVMLAYRQTFFSLLSLLFILKSVKKALRMHKNSQCKSVNIFMKQIETTEKLYIFFIQYFSYHEKHSSETQKAYNFCLQCFFFSGLVCPLNPCSEQAALIV